MRLTSGTRLGAYEIVGALGAGGMGEVYRARDLRLERDIAIKVLPRSALEDESARARLVREARLAASLNHPSICVVHDVGEAEGLVYIAMELLDGRPLTEVIRRWGTAAGCRVTRGRADRRSAGPRARTRHRAPRPEGGQRGGHSRGTSQGARLWTGGATRRGGERGHAIGREPRFTECGRRHAALHGAGGAARVAARSEIRRLVARRPPLRTGVRASSVPGIDRRRSLQCHRPRFAAAAAVPRFAIAQGHRLEVPAEGTGGAIRRCGAGARRTRRGRCLGGARVVDGRLVSRAWLRASASLR